MVGILEFPEYQSSSAMDKWTDPVGLDMRALRADSLAAATGFARGEVRTRSFWAGEAVCNT